MPLPLKLKLIHILTLLFTLLSSLPRRATSHYSYSSSPPGYSTAQPHEWRSARATYYAAADPRDAVGGACGYGDLVKGGYGMATVGLSEVLFERGQICGACFELRCVDDLRWCIPGTSIILTATNFCAPNYGIKCRKEAGIRFTIDGSNIFISVLITNVAGAGDIVAVKVKGSRTGWLPMGRNWGQNWHLNADLKNQPLSFEVTGSDGVTVTSYNVAPKNWNFGQTFEGKQFV
ncbi:expansin-a13 [Quercus suber]|uniref:Expansin n=1 Tax=Quercus suber TaxID=58331 RepID=A0AAW0J092_QUESU